LASGTIDQPFGPDLAMTVGDGGDGLVFLGGYCCFSEMNGMHISGSFTLELVGVNDGARSVTLNLSGDTYLGVPRFTMFAAAQSIDAASDMTFEWEPLPGGTGIDFALLCIEDQSGAVVYETPEVGSPGALDGLSTSVVVPAGTLRMGTDYEATLEVFKPVDSNESYAPGVSAVSAYAKSTTMGVRPAGAVVDPSPPVLLRPIPNDDQMEVGLNTVVSFVFNEPMDTSADVGRAISWSGVPDPALFEYSWHLDGHTLFCNYTPGLPAATPITWTLNPAGSLAKLRDVAGNPLPEGRGGRFETSATSNLGEPDVTSFRFGKGKRYFQSGATRVDICSYFATSFAKLNGISTVSSLGFVFPGGRIEAIGGEFRSNNQEIGGEAEYGEKADLDRIFPNGDYEITLRTLHDGQKNITLTLTPDSYPNAPTIQNFAATQAVDSRQPLTLNWAPMVGGTSDDVIGLIVEGGGACFFEPPFSPGEPGALDGTATSVTIPAGSLPPGRTLVGELVFAKVIDADITTYPGVVGTTGFTTITEFSLQTIGEPTAPEIRVVHRGAQAQVTVEGEEGRIYEIFASEDLQSWIPIWSQWLVGDCNGGYRGSFDYFDDAVGFARRFYRVEEIVSEP
jgi:hypothetical protein